MKVVETKITPEPLGVPQHRLVRDAHLPLSTLIAPLLHRATPRLDSALGGESRGSGLLVVASSRSSFF
jgi:hypothetical protein